RSWASGIVSSAPFGQLYRAVSGLINAFTVSFNHCCRAMSRSHCSAGQCVCKAVNQVGVEAVGCPMIVLFSATTVIRSWARHAALVVMASQHCQAGGNGTSAKVPMPFCKRINTPSGAKRGNKGARAAFVLGPFVANNRCLIVPLSSAGKVRVLAAPWGHTKVRVCAPRLAAKVLQPAC